MPGAEGELGAPVGTTCRGRPGGRGEARKASSEVERRPPPRAPPRPLLLPPPLRPRPPRPLGRPGGGPGSGFSAGGGGLGLPQPHACSRWSGARRCRMVPATPPLRHSWHTVSFRDTPKLHDASCWTNSSPRDRGNDRPQPCRQEAWPQPCASCRNSIDALWESRMETMETVEVSVELDRLRRADASFVLLCTMWRVSASPPREGEGVVDEVGATRRRDETAGIEDVQPMKAEAGLLPPPPRSPFSTHRPKE